MAHMDNGEKTEDKPRPVSPINGQPIPNGRPKGVPNKSTTKAREAIAMFVEGNVDRLQSWLDAIAEKDPKLAYDCFMNTVEYHIPKLARQELTGANGGAQEHDVRINDVSDIKAKILRAIPDDQLTAILAGNNDRGSDTGSA